MARPFTVLVTILWVTAVAYIGRRVILYLRRDGMKRRNGCRAPSHYPHSDVFWGSDLMKLRSRALKEGHLMKLYRGHFAALGKTWTETRSGKTIVNTIAVANVRHVFGIAPQDFDKSASQNNKALSGLFGKGVLISDGAQWQHSRTMIKPTFSKYEVGKMPMVENHVNRFIAKLPRDGHKFDVQPMLKKLFLDISSEFLFGESFDAQLPEKAAEAETFLSTLDEALLGMNKRRQGDSLAAIRLAFDKSFPAAVARVHAFIDHRVQIALAKTSQTTAEGYKKAIERDDRSRAGRYILLDELAKQTRDPVSLRSEIIQVFLPGRDNAAILVSNALFQLARHPEHWASLRQTALALGPDPEYSFETLKSLVPFRYVLQEALRTLGPGGRNQRTAAKDLVLPTGGGPDGKSPVFVSKGTLISIPLPVMHRDKDFWGDDADEFKPDRWKNIRTQWEFIPFAGGPRICPAHNQVYVQGIYVLVRLVREFETIENMDEVVDFIEISRLTTESRRGVQVSLR